ncbi:hypothetical protein ACFXJ8_15285 [Nonomuraea sp. NPDC059194]|uniref:hypothetical protein n=1 Tax=Nonomuraea sp. NPDC059194 TaxID=3346764 RepID=UPI0036D0706F
MKIMTLTMIAAAAVVSLTPGVANAEPLPSGCTSGYGYPSAGKYYYTWAKCTGGGGYVQAIATCTNGRVTTKARGPWVYVGSYSKAHCPATHQRATGHDYAIKKY